MPSQIGEGGADLEKVPDVSRPVTKVIGQPEIQLEQIWRASLSVIRELRGYFRGDLVQVFKLARGRVLMSTRLCNWALGPLDSCLGRSQTFDP